MGEPLCVLCHAPADKGDTCAAHREFPEAVLGVVRVVRVVVTKRKTKKEPTK